MSVPAYALRGKAIYVFFIRVIYHYINNDLFFGFIDTVLLLSLLLLLLL